MATVHKKRTGSVDGDDAIEDSKRVCVYSLRDSLGNNYSSSNFGVGNAEPSIVNPHFQFADTTPQLTETSEAQSASRFETEPFDSSYLLPNYDDNFGGSDK